MKCFVAARLRPARFLSSILVLWTACAAHAGAADAGAPPEGTRLPEVSILGARVEKSTDEIPATIDVIDAQRMERMLARSIRDLVRYEPNISVSGDPNRFGATGFNIRGLTDNRVLILVDGIPVPDYFDFGPGPFNVSSRNLVDIDSVSRVEILRGPASSLYGSDALGGVVSFTTKDPQDYLAEGQREWYPALRSGWSGADRGWHNTVTLAGGGERLSTMLVYTHRQAHEVESQGSNDVVGPSRTVANPQDIRSDNVVAKLVFKASDRNTFRLTGERYDSNIETNILSLNSVTPRTSALTGDDDIQRNRVSLAHDYRDPAGGALAGARWVLYHQDSESIELSDETRSNTSATCSGITAGVNTCRLPRKFSFEQQVTGATVVLDSQFGKGSTHHLVYGSDYAFTNTLGLRDATILNLTTGSTGKTLAGDAFPVRDFPETDTQKLGVFVQDEIGFADSRLLVTPAIRYDYYDVHVKPDSIYLANTPANIRAQDFSDSAVSPKIGVLYKVTPDFSVYAQYAYGFRSPPFDDLNASFRNPIQSYALIPNVNLESETSRGSEIGVRGTAGGLRFSFAAFYNRYRDFIDTSAALNCPTDPACVPGFFSTFQSVNRARVRIRGLESKVEYAFDDRWSAIAAVGYSRGDDLSAHQPINTIDPLKSVLGVNFDAPNERFGGSLIATVVDGQRRLNESTVPLFHTPGYTVVDLMAYWNITSHARLNVGAFNLLDRTYWLSSDVSRTALRPTDGGLGRFTQAPRNFSASFKYVF